MLQATLGSTRITLYLMPFYYEKNIKVNSRPSIFAITREQKDQHEYLERMRRQEIYCAWWR